MKALRVVVIGAGVSGLPSIKSCLEEDLDVICYEKEGHIGGIWSYKSSVPRSIIASTLMNTNKHLGAYSDFPPPEHFPTYLPHDLALKYLEMYAENFDLLKHIKLRHNVKKVTPLGQKWRVEIEGPNGEFDVIADAVMVCIGHDSEAEMPLIKGSEIFQNQYLHSTMFTKPEDYEGKSVLIVGSGNTAGDIAVELMPRAKEIIMSARSGFVVINRLIPGTQDSCTDNAFKISFLNSIQPYLPYWLKWHMFSKKMNPKRIRIAFRMKENDRALNNKIVINDQLANLINTNRIFLKGRLKHLTPRGAVFEEEPENEYPCDTVILATGYKVTFPFLDSKLIKLEDNKFELYKLIVPPDLPNLGFIGIVNALGPFFPLLETQARWFVQVIVGKVKLPSKDEMVKDHHKLIASSRQQKQYGRWQFLCVESIDYMNQLAVQFGAWRNPFYLFLKEPTLCLHCYFGPCLPYRYRLQGPHTWKGAKEAILQHPSVKKNKTKVHFVWIFWISSITLGVLSLTSQIF